MDNSVIREFLSSGRTLITDTMAPKSVLPKEPKGFIKEPSPALAPLENLLLRVKDEKLSKQDIIEVYKKIIDQKESEI